MRTAVVLGCLLSVSNLVATGTAQAAAEMKVYYNSSVGPSQSMISTRSVQIEPHDSMDIRALPSWPAYGSGTVIGRVRAEAETSYGLENTPTSDAFISAFAHAYVTGEDYPGGAPPLSVEVGFSAIASTRTYAWVKVKPGVDPDSIPDTTPVRLVYDIRLEGDLSGSGSSFLELDAEIAADCVGRFPYHHRKRLAMYPDQQFDNEWINTFPDFPDDPEKMLVFNGRRIDLYSKATVDGRCGATQFGLRDGTVEGRAFADPAIVIDPDYPYAEYLEVVTEPATIPEPSTLVLLCLGLSSLFVGRFFHRRNRRQATG